VRSSARRVPASSGEVSSLCIVAGFPSFDSNIEEWIDNHLVEQSCS
jgi:hypothetical protein